MGEKAEQSKRFFEQGYNCCQSVMGAFCKDAGLDFETAIKLASSFGGGMGRLREVCGAVSAMFMVAGMRYGYTYPTDKKAKDEHYKLIQRLAKDFASRRGSIICRELLALQEKDDQYISAERTEEYYASRPCTQIIGEAAEILERLLEQEKVSGQK